MRSTSKADAGRGFSALWLALMIGPAAPCGLGLRQHRLLEPVPERGDGDALDDLGAERVGQQIARRGIGQAAALQIEHFIDIELADGRAVRAFHVVGENLELRLGVDARLARSAAGCGSIATNRCAARRRAP